MMGRLSLLVAACALVGCAAVGVAKAPGGPAAPGLVRPAISTVALPLNPQDLSMLETGELAYLGGVEIRSPATQFGGLSGLRQLPDGRLLAITDHGHWLTMRPDEKNGYLLGVSDVVMAPMLDADGKPLSVRDHDSESLELALMPAPGQSEAADESVEAASQRGGIAYVGFERNHRIWVYRWAPKTPVEQLFASSALTAEDDFSAWLSNMPNNGGVEAQAISSTAKVVVSEERLHANGGHDARITHLCLSCAAPDWTTQDFGLKAEDYFRPTDAQWLPNRENRDILLVLFRSFTPVSGVQARLKWFDLTDVASGALVRGHLVASLAPPVTVDNMEGMTVVREGDRTVIYLVSDNNFNFIQRTLLLKFEWQRGPARR